MKKLMIAAAIVCAAVMSQAAGVKWSTSALYDDKGSLVAGNAKAYVWYLADETAYNKMTDIWGTYGGYITDGTASGVAAPSKTGKSQSYNNLISFTDTTKSAQYTTYYGVVITTIGSGDDLKYIAEKFSPTTGEDGSVTAKFAEAATTVDGAKTAWTAAGVPEPTSALLLLLGVAGLALRRRRA